MDTAYVVDVLLTAGAPSDDPAIEAAVEWLVSKEINIYGDWSHLNPDGKPGGWSFEHNNRWYPDVDCSVIVLKGLAGLDDDHRAAIWDVIQRANDWVITMHNRNGGWAAWDKNALDITWLQKIMNSPWVVPDLSTADVTARALQALGSLGYPGDFGDASVLPAAIEFLKGEQEDFGGWYGRWGVNYVYGAGEVLKGLALAGEDPSQPYIREAIDWLKSVQDPDGGWGESPASYDDPSLAGIGESTAAQTAYAVSGLMFAGELESDAVARGIRLLLDRQLADGSWRDEPFMGTNIAGVWYARYDLASVYKPAAALAQYLRFAAANER
jgi:squalene-hopene/tetraprenyl-beta-curcumene cyclase